MQEATNATASLPTLPSIFPEFKLPVFPVEYLMLIILCIVVVIVIRVLWVARDKVGDSSEGFTDRLYDIDIGDKLAGLEEKLEDWFDSIRDLLEW